MASDQNAQRPQQEGAAAASELARRLVRLAWKGTLATVSRSGGHPYASLVAVATEPDGAPLLLLSGLAEHTKNIEGDQRASVLIDGTSPGRAALTGPRVTLVGRLEPTATEVSRQRYLSRHPDAAGFIDFADFALYRLHTEWAHLVAGFGRIVRLSAADVAVQIEDARDLIEAEPSIIAHMNDDHSDAIALMARETVADATPSDPQLAAQTSGPWRMIGCDPEGIDLTDGQRACRIAFPRRIATTDAVREVLIDMLQSARSRN